MKSLTPYEVNRSNYIKAILKSNLLGFSNQQGQQATFADIGWKYTLLDGTSVNFLFYDRSKCPSNKKHLAFGSLDNSWKLDDFNRHLLMAYTIDVALGNITLATKQAKVRVAREILSNDGFEPHNLTQVRLDSIFSGLYSTQGRYRKSFINWLILKEFVPPNLKLKSLKDDKDGYDRRESLVKKIPEEKVLAALGAIFFDVINPDEPTWPKSTIYSQRDAFVCAMSALAMASPNRVAAEQVTLVNQDIKSFSFESGQSIHWLDWKGSKGYKDNQNHLLANMIAPLNRALKYIRQATEPARVLARFYEDPNTPLEKLLGKFKAQPRRIREIGGSKNKPVHLIQLGYLLGFFDEKEKVTVTPGTPGAEKKPGRGFRYYRKELYLLSALDRIIISENTSVASVLGTTLKQADIDQVFGREQLSSGICVKDFQRAWIRYFMDVNPTFPETHVNGGNKVKYSAMMFAFTGRQIAKSASGHIGQTSWFSLVRGEQLSHLLYQKLGGSTSLSIFEKFGFSKDFKITPHQFRHWLNNTGDQAGIAHRIINLWSGRKNPEQLMHYIHSSEGEKANAIRDILFHEDKAVTEDNIGDIKVYSQHEYESLLGVGDGISSATNTGFCVQNLLTSPCEYTNDFETQCTLCTSSCHVKGDGKCLDLLTKDYEYQLRRLEVLKERPNFTSSKRLQKWFDVHYRNTTLLKELLELLKSPDIDDGSVIRVVPSRGEIRVTNLSNKSVSKQKLSLPSSKSALEQIIDDITSNETNSENTMNELLSMIPRVR